MAKSVVKSVVKSVRISAGGRVSGEENRSFNVAGTSTFLSIACSTAEYLGIDDARWHTLLVIPAGESVEGAVGRFLAHAREQMDEGKPACLRDVGKCPTCSKELLSGCRECDLLLPTAEAELAGETVVEVVQDDRGWWRVQGTCMAWGTEGFRSVGIARPGLYAIRRLDDAPKPAPRPWRLKSGWLICSECERSHVPSFKACNNAECPNLGIEWGEPRELAAKE